MGIAKTMLREEHYTFSDSESGSDGSDESDDKEAAEAKG